MNFGQTVKTTKNFKPVPKKINIVVVIVFIMSFGKKKSVLIEI